MGKLQIAIPVLAGCILMTILVLTESYFSIYQQWFNGYRDFILLLSPLIGRILGCIVFCLLAEVIGRKYSLTGVVLPFIISCAICQFSLGFVMNCIAGILLGIASGGGQAILPIYISEIAEKSSRGMLVSSLSLASVIGTTIVGNIIHHILQRDIFISYSIFIYLYIVLAVVVGILFGILATESPVYYLKKRNEYSAKIALTKLRNVHDTQLELNDLQGNTTISRMDNLENNHRIMPCLKANGFVKALIIILSLTIFHSLCGIYVTQFYLFHASIYGSPLSMHISQWIINGVTVISTAACVFAVDRIGRKMCLLISFGGMAVSYIYLGILTALLSTGSITGSPYLFIPFTIIFYASYSFGAGPIPLVLLGEMFSLRTKMLMSAIITIINPILQQVVIGVSVSWIPFSISMLINFVICVKALIVVHFLYLETSKKSLNEIQLALNRY